MQLLLSALTIGILSSPVQANAASPDVRTLYTQSTVPHKTTSHAATLIPGRTLTLPAGAPHRQSAIVTFDAPTLEGNATCIFGIYSAGTQYAVGYTYQWAPMVIVTKVPLGPNPQTVDVEWNIQGSPGLFCSLAQDSGVAFYSLSAILTAD